MPADPALQQAAAAMLVPRDIKALSAAAAAKLERSTARACFTSIDEETRMKSPLWLVAFGVAFVVAAAAKADAISDEMKKFEGTWLVHSATRDGKPAADWKDGQVVFAGDRVTMKGPAGKREFIYKVDPSKKPKTIDFTSAKKDTSEAPELAIYELDGDTLKLCTGPVDERPTEFNDKKRLLAVLKRKK
jgi:uncharacterized protein (TIGR03067 family)